MSKPYQDQWRDGALVTKGRRECTQRFDAIATRLGTIGSLVDVGGWDGYFARRFAEQGVECTLIEPRQVSDLPELVTHRRERITASTQLAPVDAVLAVSVLHHVEDWEAVYENMRAACRVLIVETPPPDETDTGAPVIEETKHRIDPLWGRVDRDGEVFATTPGPNGTDRPLFAVPNTFTGAVENGLGRAAEVMGDHNYQQLGYEPVPGTLNVKVGRAGKAWVKSLPRPVTVDGVDYWPVDVHGIDCHVRVTRAQTTVEVVAPVTLRSVLDLSNGDEVELRVR